VHYTVFNDFIMAGSWMVTVCLEYKAVVVKLSFVNLIGLSKMFHKVH
jgi:hypothetical protein